MNLLLSTRRRLGLVLELKLRRAGDSSSPRNSGSLAAHQGQRFRVPGSTLTRNVRTVPEAVWRFHEWAAAKGHQGSELPRTRYCLVLVNGSTVLHSSNPGWH